MSIIEYSVNIFFERSIVAHFALCFVESSAFKITINYGECPVISLILKA